MKTKKKKKKRYSLGTGRSGVVRNYIESPDTTLMQNQIKLAGVYQEAANNPWTQGLDVLGGMAMQSGVSMMSQGGGTSALSKKETWTKKAMGGKVGKSGVPVEVEGEEVGETPDGQLIDFKGPSHENGGIDINLPEGTEIFSKRISVKGKTMAERKKAREKKVMTLEKLLEKSKGDAVLKNSLKRTNESNAKEEQEDQKLQEMVGAMKQMAQFAYGTGKEGVQSLSTGGSVDWSTFLKQMKGGQNPPDEFTIASGIDVNTFTEKNPGDKSFADGQFVNGYHSKGGRKLKTPNITGGDAIGLAGTLYSTFESSKNTQANRAGDTPNINGFEDYGNDALDRIDEAKGYIAGQRDKSLKDLETNRTGAVQRNRKSARGVNTMRALDLGTDVNTNKAQSDIFDNFSKQMMQMLSTQAGFENQQDQAVMSGEERRDLADRQDRDNYYSQMAEDIATKGEGIQQIGKMLNQNKLSNVKENSLKTISKNGFQIDTNGNVVDKNGVTMDLSKLRKIAKDNNMTLEEVYEAIKNQ